MNDDELLELLERSFPVEPGDPPPASVAALRRAACGESPRRVRHGYRGRRWASAALLGAVLSGGWGVAYAAAGDPLPGPVRQAAYEIGLPVSSADLIDARHDLDALRAALADGATDIRVRADELRRGLASLDEHERRKIQRDADELLQQVDDDQSSSSPRRGTGATEPATAGSSAESGGDGTQANDEVPSGSISSDTSRGSRGDGDPSSQPSHAAEEIEAEDDEAEDDEAEDDEAEDDEAEDDAADDDEADGTAAQGLAAQGLDAHGLEAEGDDAGETGAEEEIEESDDESDDDESDDDETDDDDADDEGADGDE